MWKGSDFVIINWDWFLSPDDLKEGPGIGIGNVRAIIRPGLLGIKDKIRGKAYRYYTRFTPKQPVIPD